MEQTKGIADAAVKELVNDLRRLSAHWLNKADEIAAMHFDPAERDQILLEAPSLIATGWTRPAEALGALVKDWIAKQRGTAASLEIPPYAIATVDEDGVVPPGRKFFGTTSPECSDLVVGLHEGLDGTLSGQVITWLDVSDRTARKLRRRALAEGIHVTDIPKLTMLTPKELDAWDDSIFETGRHADRLARTAVKHWAR